MPSKKTISILGKVESIHTDRTRYKNYSPEVTFEDLYVQFEIPADEAVQKPDGKTIVTLDGFAYAVLDTFASHLEAMHSDWERRKAEADEKAQLEQMQKSRRKSKS